jgi:hypothetical protein
MLTQFKSDPGTGHNSPVYIKGYYFKLSWPIGRITGACIETT